MVISSEFDIDLRYVSESAGGRSESGPDITISPSVMFFLAPQLAVGGLLGFHHESAEEVSLSRFTFGPTVAYNIPVSERASVFPTVGILYGWAKSSSRTQGGRVSNSGYDIGLLLKAPFLFHPFPHVFVGFGPVIVLDFASKVDVGTATKTRSIRPDPGFRLLALKREARPGVPDRDIGRASVLAGYFAAWAAVALPGRRPFSAARLARRSAKRVTSISLAVEKVSSLAR